MKKSKRKSLLKESIYQILLLSFCFVGLVGIVVFYSSIQRFEEKKKYIQSEIEKSSQIQNLHSIQTEIKNIYNYLSYEHNYVEDCINVVLKEQAQVIEKIAQDVNEDDLNNLINAFKEYSKFIIYDISDVITNDKQLQYTKKLNNEKYLSISLNKELYFKNKLGYVLTNIDKFSSDGEISGHSLGFYTKVLQEKITENKCDFTAKNNIASYKCFDSFWNIEFGADYDMSAIYNQLKAQKKEVNKKIIQQFLIISVLVILGIVGIIVFIKNKERIIKDNIKSINQSLSNLDGNLANLKLNLNPNIKYEEFKFLNLALNKFIVKMKKTQELIINQNKEILQKAYYDNVTGLKNIQKLIMDLTKHQYQNQTKLAVFFIDLDKFKQVNESKGRMVGDKILSIIANRLKSLTDNNLSHASRIASDEFIIAKEFDINEDIKKIEHFAHEVLELINQPMQIEDEKFYFTATIGVAIYSQEEYNGNYEELIRSADSAMSIGKKKGANHIEFYNKTIDDRRKEILKIQKNLHVALQQKEFKMFFQPKINVKTGEIVGAEALIRWIQNGKVLPPSYFIEIAEGSNLIIEIGKWVIDESFKILRSWIDDDKAIKISLNLSVKQLKSETLIQDIEQSLKKYKIPPKLIEFEITENFAIQDKENIDKINELKTLGVGLSMDDFGTGYSSLAYLHNLSFDVVKIDMSFVFNMSKDPKKQALVDAIVQMSKTLDKKTVAEGVEFKDDLDLLKKFGCDEFQGYYFSKPLPEDEFYQLLNK